MTRSPNANNRPGTHFAAGALLLVVAVVSWLIPGGGYFLLKENKRAVIVFTAIVLTFCAGLYIGSIGVVDLVGTSPFYVKAAQIMNPPVVFAVAYHTAGGGFRVYGWPNELGQIYTMTSGLLNLLCIVNAVYLAHLRRIESAGE
ncbi:unnamed protein product [marine sediment metagenome]|uniref:DUF6677 domain-containing protein n=1 Tax=marine sediment metagenome TaxID=412755 RepID=X1QBS6_9ZZZZ